LPTYREGLGMVLVESAAAGIPVITSHIRGCKDVVVDGVTGRLVSPKDIHGLAEAVTELAFDSDKRRRMGDAARRLVVERFDARYFHIEVDALYRRLLTEKRTTSNGS